MVTSPANARGIDALKELSGVMNLVILPLSCFPGCAVQRLREVALVHIFKIRVTRKCVHDETLLVVGAERIRIRDDPCFHCLNHEMNGIIVNAAEVPSVSCRQMVGRVRRAYRILGVHQKHDNAGIPVRACVLKAFVRLITTAATNQSPMPVSCRASPPDFGQKHFHSLAQLRSRARSPAAAFHVDCEVHGLAPSSPIRHRSPSA